MCTVERAALHSQLCGQVAQMRSLEAHRTASWARLKEDRNCSTNCASAVWQVVTNNVSRSGLTRGCRAALGFNLYAITSHPLRLQEYPLAKNPGRQSSPRFSILS